MSGSKSGKIKKTKATACVNYHFHSLPFSLSGKNENLAPRKVCTVKNEHFHRTEKKMRSADMKRGAEIWTFINKKSFSPQRVLMQRAVDAAFTARNIVPLKELRGACVCD